MKMYQGTFVSLNDLSESDNTYVSIINPQPIEDWGLLVDLG